MDILYDQGMKESVKRIFGDPVETSTPSSGQHRDIFEPRREDNLLQLATLCPLITIQPNFSSAPSA